MNELYFIPLGVLVGMISSFFGLGGGIVFVPTLSYLFAPREAVAISVFAMVFSSLFGTFLNIKSKAVEFKYCIFMAVGGIFGGILSSFVLLHVESIYLLIAFFIFGVYSLYNFIFKGKKTKSNMHTRLSDKQKFIGMFFGGVLTGVFAISLGIGGGLILAPIVANLLGYDSKKIVPVSLFFIVFSSISGLLSFYNAGFISPEVRNVGIVIGISSLVGVFIGNKLLYIVKTSWHRISLITIFLFSILMTFNKILVHYGWGIAF